jgi:hypothetical protein
VILLRGRRLVLSLNQRRKGKSAKISDSIRGLGLIA